MEIGMIGLGRMGSNMAERLIKGGHEIIGYDRDREALGRTVGFGASPAESVEDLVGRLSPPRSVWLMVPAGDPVDQTVDQLATGLDHGDAVIDGGNSYYRDTLRRAEALARRGIDLVDAGTSGGVWGLEEGYSLMVGGPERAVDRLRPIFEVLAPGPDSGWGHVGPSGAGHFVKMVHNGIEYGLMQAYAEGFSVLHSKTEFGFDLHQIAEIWRFGSVIRSWLLDLASRALTDDPGLSDIAPYVEDSGEGRWTVFEAIDLDVSVPVIALSLLERFRSRDSEAYGDRLLAALRGQFGGHAVKRGD